MMTEGVISEVILNNKSSRPTALQFQNGELLEDQETNLSCGLYTNDANRILPVLASDSLIYTGPVVGQNAYNTFLAIKNKKTNKIKLVAINEAMVKPQPPKVREIMDSTMMEANKTAITDLHKEFGSKRTKRQTETLERLKVNVDNFKDQLEKTVANISLEEMEVEEVQQSSEILPNFNENAKNAEDVYTLGCLIPNNIMESLTGASERLMEMEEAEIKTTDFIKKQIMEMQDSKDEDVTHNVAILLVLDAIVDIYSSTVKAIVQKGYEPSKYSLALSQFVMNTFTVKSDRTRLRPFSMKDKACCYIILLTMILNKNNVNLEDLSIELKLSLKKLQELCTQMRLSVKDKHAFVKLPLPEVRVFRSKGKKGKGRK